MRHIIIIFSIAFLLGFSVNAISQDSLCIGIREPWPTYPGGDIGLNEFIHKNLMYPVEAISNKKSGVVWISAYVEIDGTTSCHQLERGVDPSFGINEEALRISKLLSGFKPGMRNGKVVRMQMMFPIKFVLEEVIEKK